MFARVNRLKMKPGSAEKGRQISEKALSLMRAQPGFMDEMTLVSNDDPTEVLVIAFWKTEEDADRYRQDKFPEIREKLHDLLAAPPEIETYNVEWSMAHHIAAGKAA